MKIVKHIKDAFRHFSCWMDHVFSSDRLTVQPRKINANFVGKFLRVDICSLAEKYRGLKIQIP